VNKHVHELADTELDRVCGGNEMAMIKFQSMLSQRQMMLQMITSIFRAMNDTTGAIIKNIR
jgi:hypothetical protein